MKSIKQAVRYLMLNWPETYYIKEDGIRNREKMVLEVQRLLRKTVSPEAVTREQRRFWTANPYLEVLPGGEKSDA